MKWSLRIGSLFGIGIYLHWTFLILIGLIVFASRRAGESLGAVLASILYVAAVFACIVLHELGHALAARRYGIPTRDITLLPIGGVARLERMPERPLEELVVAAAGPAVNVIIAAVLAIVLMATGNLSVESVWPPTSHSLLMNVLSVNLFLVLFNLLPAFPMDGGRMLRALLATRMDYSQATNIAAGVGQFMAIAFAIYGLFIDPNPFLVFIALFVYLGAEGEARLVQIRSLLRDVPVRDAMMTRFRTLTVQDTLQHAADELLAGTQQEFPVMADGQFRGMLGRDALVQGLKEAGPQASVEGLTMPQCRTVSERDLLQRVMEEMREAGCTTLPVMRGPQLVGLVSLENVGELMMIRSALRNEPVADEGLARSA
jgi:Zn-dependent protease